MINEQVGKTSLRLSQWMERCKVTFVPAASIISSLW